MDDTNKKIEAKRENSKRFNNSDYETGKSVENFFQKNGYLKSLLFVFVFVPFFFVNFIWISFYIVSVITWLGGLIFCLSGIGLYVYSKKLKENNSIFIKENFNSIELSTPFYYDLSLIFSGLLFFSGIFFILVSFQIWWMLLPFSIIVFYVYFRSYFKLRYSIFDKIIILRENIKIDDPKSKESIFIYKSDISKLVLLTVKNSFEEKRIIEFQFETSDSYKAIEVDETQIKNLRLNFDLVTDSLTKMGYILKKETHIVGKLNRLDENGNQILD